MTSVFGRVVIRRSKVKVVYLDCDPELFSEENKVDVDFLPASWLRYWTGCGMFLARMGFGKPTVDINFTVARVLDFDSDFDTRKAMSSVITGDIHTLMRSLQSKVIYPTDRCEDGRSLLSVSDTVSITLNVLYRSICERPVTEAHTLPFLFRLRLVANRLQFVSCYCSKGLPLVSIRLLSPIKRTFCTGFVALLLPLTSNTGTRLKKLYWPRSGERIMTLLACFSSMTRI